MRELVLACFADEASVLLARAAMSRMQKHLSLGGNDLVLIIREDDHTVRLHQVVDLGGECSPREEFWRNLANLLFGPGPAPVAIDDDRAGKLAAIGIDEAFARRARKLFRESPATLLVVVKNAPNRDKVLALLHGFVTELARTSLAANELST